MITNQEGTKMGRFAVEFDVSNYQDVVAVRMGTLDPAKVSGKIVLCTRGTNPRVQKSATVKDAGGVGMILVNPSPNSLDADFHAVPARPSLLPGLAPPAPAAPRG